MEKVALKALKVLGFAFLVFITIPIACRLASWLPTAVPAIGCVAFAIGAAWPKKHDAESLAMAEDMFGALDDVGIKGDAAAAIQEITASQLSSQRVGREQPGAYKWARLGPEFRIAWATRMLRREGLDVTRSGGLDSMNHALLHELFDELRELRERLGMSRRREVA